MIIVNQFQPLPKTRKGEPAMRVFFKKETKYETIYGIQAELVHLNAISELTRTHPNLLSRTPEEIADLIENFCVAVSKKGETVGCAGFKRSGEDIEIIAVRITEKYNGCGIAPLLLASRLESIKSMNSAKHIFALSTRPVAEKLFLPNGFVEVGIQLFDEKVIRDCKRCLKNNYTPEKGYQCDEIALLYKK